MTVGVRGRQALAYLLLGLGGAGNLGKVGGPLGCFTDFVFVDTEGCRFGCGPVVAVLARCGGDRLMLGRLVQKFEVKSKQLLNDLEIGCRAHDAAATARLAHSIKGTAANLSATRVAELAEQIEDLGRAADLSEVDAMVSELGVELKRCHQALRLIATDAEDLDAAAKPGGASVTAPHSFAMHARAAARRG